MGCAGGRNNLAFVHKMATMAIGNVGKAYITLPTPLAYLPSPSTLSLL